MTSKPKKENNMKKIITALACLIFTANIVCAQDVFLSLTKYDEDIDKLPANVTIIDSKQIANSRAQTAAKLIQNETGINLITYGTIGAASSVSIRGASSLQTLLLIDGRRVNDIGMGSADFTAIPVKSIERVEIIRGAGAAVYGTGAFGGVINIITRKASSESPLAEAGLSYGAFNTYNNYVNGAYADDMFAVFASLANTRSDGSRANSAFDGKSVFASLQAKVSGASELSLTGNVYDSSYGVPGMTVFPTPDNEQKDNNKYIKLDYNLALSKSAFLNVSGYASHNIRNFFDATGNPYDFALASGEYKYVSDVYGGQADFHYKNIFLAGIECWSEGYNEKEELSGHNLDKSRTNYAGYAQLNLPFYKFVLIPSVRYDNNSQYGSVATPAVSAVFNATESLKFSANTGKVWRAPAFTELYWDQPNYFMFGDPNLKPEHGISSDAGVEYSKGKIKLAGNAYYIDSKDLIIWNSDPVTYEYRVGNVGKAKQYGYEIEAGYFMTSWLSHKLNYTYLKTENGDTGKQLAYKPTNTVNYTLTVKPVDELSVSAVVFYRDSVFTDSANTNKLDGFITLDLNVDYKINDNIKLWAKGLNVGNAKYELSQYYPMPGAAVYAGVEIKVLR